MKTIYINENMVSEVVKYINNEMTFFDFLSHTKAFLKQLMTNPLNADVDDYMKENGVNRETLIKQLLNRGIIEKDNKIVTTDNTDKFSTSYLVPKKNFDRKMERLYSELFENDEIIEEEGGGATGCAGCLGGGGSNPEAGTYTTPLGKVQRRTIYVTEKQMKTLQETATSDAGDYQYDVPFKFNGGNDPTYDHKNMMAKSFPKKKIGIRKKGK